MGVCPAEPKPGLRASDFRKICENGFGDGFNAYAYSMAWFNSRILVGTGRANLILLKFGMPFVTIDQWPVATPHPPYSPEFESEAACGEIWSYDPGLGNWDRVHASAMVEGVDGTAMRRHLGFRSMAVFQGASDARPSLYVASWSRSKGFGPEILRSEDGRSFDVLPRLHFRDQREETPITAIRSLVAFKGRLFTAPTGSAKGNVNVSMTSLIYESRDPSTGEWQSVNDPGFEDLRTVQTVYSLCAFGDYLYAGTGGLPGFQIWRTRGEGKPPYHWEKVLGDGAGRGPLNQGAVSLRGFQDALYIGTGIQNGGNDMKNKIGPAAAEVLRLNPDGSYDIICGTERDGRKPLSGLGPGFGNFFSGYLWMFEVHEGWLYASTMDWSVICKFSKVHEKPSRAAQLIARSDVDEFVNQTGGFELWRTADGVNWVPVSRTGMGNPYNYGGRNLVSTPHGLFVGTANPFGPQVAVCKSRKDWEWTYEPNPRGGLEVWQGVRQ
jgi:hypothetical protein